MQRVARWVQLWVILLAAAMATACGGGGSSSGGSVPAPIIEQINAAIPASLQVYPATPLNAPGTKRQFHAIETLTDGTKLDVTDQVTWSSDNNAVTFSLV